MALRNGTQWEPTEDIAHKAGGAVVAEIGPGGGMGRCDGFSPDRIGFLLNYTLPAMAAGPDVVTYVAPLTIRFQATRAILLASATAANFGDLRLRSSASQGDALRGGALVGSRRWRRPPARCAIVHRQLA
jgi:hypothetical protein